VDPLLQAALLALVGGVAGVGGAFLKDRIERRTAAKLGLPSDTEKRIVDLREELIGELEREVKRREQSERDCLVELGKEVQRREQLEHKVDEQQAQINRLLRRLPGGAGE
jgi:hypothetical protein